MPIEREGGQNKLAEAILANLPRKYDPKEKDLLKSVSIALHTFLTELYEDKDKRVEFLTKYSLDISEMVKLHNMFRLLEETGSTGDTGKLLDTLLENSRFK